ncbi:hypothetical protein BJY04DRAFT_196154 [Aspergillus karnatakaensis]|uniref:protein PET117 n=1 Tax=Aspergillus karnatakaensis TaxID=1810916 RepID=UPI003CCD7D85
MPFSNSQLTLINRLIFDIFALFVVLQTILKMSRASKLTFLGTSLATAGIVYFVHWSQEQEKASMHKGVERDMEKQRIRLERQADFEMQKQLEEEYRKIQTVSPSTDGPPASGGQTNLNSGS